MMEMLQTQAFVKTFRACTDDNWRNSFFIRCADCRYEHESDCGGFLFVPDEQGCPLLLPIQTAEQSFGLIDMGECLGQMSNLMFQELYKRWLNACVPRDGACPFLECFRHTVSSLPKENQ